MIHCKHGPESALYGLMEQRICWEWSLDIDALPSELSNGRTYYLDLLCPNHPAFTSTEKCGQYTIRPTRRFVPRAPANHEYVHISGSIQAVEFRGDVVKLQGS